MTALLDGFWVVRPASRVERSSGGQEGVDRFVSENDAHYHTIRAAMAGVLHELGPRDNSFAGVHPEFIHLGTQAEVAKRAVRSNPDYPLAYRWLAAALGQTAEAKEALEKAIAIAPATFDMYVRQGVPWHRSQDRAHMLEGLRKAGWREE
jgi:hypothetical protein